MLNVFLITILDLDDILYIPYLLVIKNNLLVGFSRVNIREYKYTRETNFKKIITTTTETIKIYKFLVSFSIAMTLLRKLLAQRDV